MPRSRCTPIIARRACCCSRATPSEIDGVPYELKAGDMSKIPANLPHRFINRSSTQGMKILWIYGCNPDPTSRPATPGRSTMNTKRTWHSEEVQRASGPATFGELPGGMIQLSRSWHLRRRSRMVILGEASRAVLCVTRWLRFLDSRSANNALLFLDNPLDFTALASDS